MALKTSLVAMWSYLQLEYISTYPNLCAFSEAVGNNHNLEVV